VSFTSFAISGWHRLAVAIIDSKGKARSSLRFKELSKRTAGLAASNGAMTLLAKDVALNDSLLSDLYAYGFISLFAVQAVVAAVFSILYTKDIIVLRHAEEFPAHRARRRISCVGAFILLIFSLSNIAVILVESIVKDFGRTSSGVFLLSLVCVRLFQATSFHNSYSLSRCFLCLPSSRFPSWRCCRWRWRGNFSVFESRFF